MLRRVVLVRTDVSEESSASIIKVIRIGDLATTLSAISIRSTLHNIAKDGIIHSHRLQKPEILHNIL
jgi:DNA-binding TFAR19-related protein (PDSD5 family)